MYRWTGIVFILFGLLAITLAGTSEDTDDDTEDVVKDAYIVSVLNSQIQATKEKGKDNDLKISVTNPEGKAAGKVKVYLVKAYRTGKESSPLLSNQELNLAKEESNVYALDFLAARPEPGSYVLEIRVIPQDNKSPSATFSTSRRVKVVAQVGLSEGQISISDTSDRELNARTHQFSEGKPVANKLTLGPKQHVYVTFKLKNVAGGKSVTVHQTFVQFKNTETGKSVYVTATSSGQSYEAHLDVAKYGKKFDFQNGSYDATVIVGDPHIEKQLKLPIGKFDIKFDEKVSTAANDRYSALPEIHHRFRPAAVLASEAISNVFSILVLSPLALLIVGVFRAGGNLSNYPTSGLTPIYALAFLGSLGSMFFWIVLYWLQLTLFPTLTMLAFLSIPTIVFGNFVLKHYAEQRIPKQKTQ